MASLPFPYFRSASRRDRDAGYCIGPGQLSLDATLLSRRALDILCFAETRRGDRLCSVCGAGGGRHAHSLDEPGDVVRLASLVCGWEDYLLRLEL